MSFFRELLGYLSQVIIFKDANVKRRLLASSSVNPDGSGDITYSEAANVSASALHSALSGQTDIVSFNELRFFTNYGDLPTNFLKDCENLEEVTFPVVSTWPTTYGTNILANTNVWKLDLRGVTAINVNHLEGTKFGSMPSLQEVWINDLTSLNGDKVFTKSNHPDVRRVVISSERQWVTMTVDDGTFTPPNIRPTASGKATLYKDDLEHPITEFTVPSDVSTISRYAFDGIQGLSKIIIQSSVTCGAGCFRNLPASTTIVGYGNITSIGDNCFVGCLANGITGIPSGMTSIGRDAYAGSSITSVISSTLASIGINSFANCTKLETVSISLDDGTISLPDASNTSYGAFQNCTGLVYVHLNPITLIGNTNFSGCSSLRTCECFGLTIVKTQAFAGCSSLVTFDARTLTKVGSRAFYNCQKLENINFDLADLEVIEAEAFYNCKKLKCPSTFGSQLTKIGSAAFCDCIASSTTVRLTSASVVEFELRTVLAEEERYRSPFPSSVTKIQVPSSLVADYESDTKWAAFRDYYPGITIEGYTP